MTMMTGLVTGLDRDNANNLRRIADSLETIAEMLEAIRVELKKKRFDDAVGGAE